MDDLARTIGACARTARAGKGLTQPEVAELVGIAAEVYGRIERGLTQPSVPTLVKLARALGVTPNDLLDFGASEAPVVSGEPPELTRLVTLLSRADRRTHRILLPVVRALVK